jgi:hypothetical protein
MSTQFLPGLPAHHAQIVPARRGRGPRARVPTLALAQAKTDFSGTWVLDVEKSWSGTKDGPRLPAETLVVRQAATSISSWSLSPNGKVLTVDGAASSPETQPIGEKVTDELKVKRVYLRQ